MMLSTLTDRDEIARYVQGLEQLLRTGSEVHRCEVGFQGGAMELDLHWHAGQGIWAGFQKLDNRFWFGFGAERPFNLIGIVCEINIPIQGINRRVAGALGRDDQGQVFYLHSGKVGGGRPGIGREAFLAFRGKQPMATLAWPDQQRTAAIPIGRIGDERLLGQIAEFVRLVERFKAQAVMPANQGYDLDGVSPK